MAMLWFTPFSDQYSEAAALAQALTDWIAKQPAQPQQPLKVLFVKYDDGSLSAMTTEPLMRLVK
ncbi:hypothetical protein [Pseudomonas izuensis]|uniref:hypothetical protein n=1 Tax=Pseudomonas izuensis TaxID=2684212 RepID=UPI001356C5A4|nr:hypothetical protein [Pseudomonas izuensis]